MRNAHVTKAGFLFVSFFAGDSADAGRLREMRAHIDARIARVPSPRNTVDALFAEVLRELETFSDTDIRIVLEALGERIDVRLSVA